MTRGPNLLEIINIPCKGEGSNKEEGNVICVYSHVGMCVSVCIRYMNVHVNVYMQACVYTRECIYI